MGLGFWLIFFLIFVFRGNFFSKSHQEGQGYHILGIGAGEDALDVTMGVNKSGKNRYFRFYDFF